MNLPVIVSGVVLAVAVAATIMNRATVLADPPTVQSFQDCADCPEMVALPKGSFTMGSAETAWSSPPFNVNVQRRFAIGRYEVTFAEWDACVDDGGCEFSPATEATPGGDWARGNRPVMNVSWNDAQEYVDWLSEKTGRNYRLPTEAQWEYAARAGTATRYYWGQQPSRAFMNYGKNNVQEGFVHGSDLWFNTAPVGSFKPSAFGLYDTAGNVWEWTQDCWQEGYAEPPAVVTAKAGEWPDRCDEKETRTMRGGGWFDTADITRVAQRNYHAPDYRMHAIGFRVVRDMSEPRRVVPSGRNPTFD